MRKRLLVMITLLLAVSLSLGGALQVSAVGGDSFQMETEEMMDVTMSVEIVDPEKEAIIVRVNSLLFARYEEILVALSLADSKENVLSFVATESNAVAYVEGIDFDYEYSVFIHMEGDERSDYCYGTLEFRYKGDSVKAYHRLSHEVATNEESQPSPNDVSYETESNNTIGSANRIYDDDTILGQISTSTDVDYYKVMFEEEGNANFWLGNIPAGKDFDFYLYNAAGTLIEQSTTTNNQEQIYEVPVLSGVWYYMKVVGYNGANSSGYYQVRAKVYPSGVTPDAFEANNSVLTATWISGNDGVSANIHSQGDEDYYLLVFPTAGVLDISLYNIPSGCDYDLELLDANGVRLDISTNAYTTAEQISISLAAGTYYVRVYPYSGYSATHYLIASDYTTTGTVQYQFDVYNYLDQGYRTRFSGGLSAVEGHTEVVSELFEDLFNLQANMYVYTYDSYVDSCKILSYGEITMENLQSECMHYPEHYDRNNLVERFALERGIGSQTTTNVLWTGHILEDNASSAAYFPPSYEYYAAIITPKHTTDQTDFSNLSNYEYNKQSRYTLMHELSHELGLPDHYCYNPDLSASGGRCGNSQCYTCVWGLSEKPICMMQTRINVENSNIGLIYCPDCHLDLRQHLSDHHY